MAARKIYTFSAATVSWINPQSRLMGLPLPECDPAGEPPKILTWSELSAGEICRFSQVLTCSIAVENGKIVRRDVAPESGLHMRPSFLKTAPRAYATRRDFTSTSAELATFAQTVGCRTQAPEITGHAVGSGVGEGIETVGEIALGPFLGPIARAVDDVLEPGKRIGGKVGRETAEMMAFPPIWTTLYVVMFPSGQSMAYVKAHSLFPSMTYYEARSSGPLASTLSLLWERKHTYNGVPYIDAWRSTGWGKGNPWRIQSPAGVVNDSIR